MTVSHLEREQAKGETNAFYGEAEDRCKALFRIVQMFGHHQNIATSLPI